MITIEEAIRPEGQGRMTEARLTIIIEKETIEVIEVKLFDFILTGTKKGFFDFLISILILIIRVNTTNHIFLPVLKMQIFQIRALKWLI